MFNEELYKELEQHYGVERMIDFAEIMVTRYDLLWDDSISDNINEENFERDWWYNKYVELKTLPEDRIIKDSLNKVDYCIVKLQEDLLDSITCLEKLKTITKEIGYNPSKI
jgi:hypothetical protein